MPHWLPAALQVLGGAEVTPMPYSQEKLDKSESLFPKS